MSFRATAINAGIGCQPSNTVSRRKKKNALGSLPEKTVLSVLIKNSVLGFPGGAVVENPPANAGDTGSSPGLGRSHMPRSN